MRSLAFECPCNPEPLDSPFYIQFPSLEALAYQEIVKPGSMILIKSPPKTGKTSLILRLLNYASQSGYSTIYLDFQQADEKIFGSLDTLLRWFCTIVSQELQLTPKLDDYWDDDIGSNVSCSVYFQDYLLANITNPIVLVINAVERIFEYPEVAKDFLSLLRFWHEQAPQELIWQNLRLIIAYSTEVYLKLDIYCSPFNLGITIKLPEFTLEQILDLAQRYGLNWTKQSGKMQAMSLHNMVGGHPYLLRLAFYHLINSPQISLAELLQAAPTMSGIYKQHLQKHLATLQKNPELASAFKKAIAEPNGVQLNHIQAYKLEGMGLVKLKGNLCTVSCELYRQYFNSQNWEELSLQQQLVQLQQQLQELRHLYNTDELTQLPNRRGFDSYLQQVWQSLATQKAPLSLIFLKIDYFRAYNDARGQQAGDECLQQISTSISNLLQHYKYFIARYHSDEFAVILPKRKAYFAFKLGEIIRSRIKNLGIKHDSKIYGFPASVITISVGVASTIPQLEDSPTTLVNAASEALLGAKRKGRDLPFGQ
jgi:diguanylate cyclase (GGDEF)-like protein